MNARTFLTPYEEAKVIALCKPAFQMKRKPSPTIYINQSNGVLPIKIENILYCIASSNYSIIHLTNGKKVVVSKCLKHVENQINNPSFVRIHASYLVHVNHIQFANYSSSPSVTIRGKKIPIARSRKKNIKLQLTNLN